MESIWTKDVTLPQKQQLREDLKKQAVVIGAGMAGLLTAYLLREKGVDVAVIDAGSTASGFTQNTTAKITAQHRLIYHKLKEKVGLEKAQMYAEANMQAIQKYSEIIQKNAIDCNFETLSSFVYAIEDDQNVQNEVVAAQSVNIPAAFVDSVTLPLKVRGAVEFTGQAQFHPLKFIASIANGLEIYENTMAMSVEDNIIRTLKGDIQAEHIVVATHYPFINSPGFYFMRLHQERSYVLALQNAENVHGMYADENSSGFSFRNYGDLLLLGGGSHRTGENTQGGRYEILREAAGGWYPNAEEICHWSAQDCMPHDDIPYIGQYAIGSPNLYVATGFKKWGMTGSMVSAMLLSDMITEKANPWAEIFSPQRINLAASAKNFVIDSATAVSGILTDLFSIPDDRFAEIRNGHGGIVEYNGEKVGIYKSELGEIYKVQTHCTHLGCQLAWNPDERNWECPCHGSRFNYNGDLINNPAMKGLV